jgi:polyhydroxyalkanoate synthase
VSADPWIAFTRRAGATVETLLRVSGVEPGGSAREEIYAEDKLRLYRYLPPDTAPQAGRRIPLLIVYALVNRPTLLDLEADRSLIRRLMDQGLDVYLIDWGMPDGADRFLDLDDYINGYIDRCVQHVLDAHGLQSVDLLGVCQGGTFSLCYTALHPERVRNLVTMVTPVDFQTPENLLSQWAQRLDVDALVEAHGVVPGEVLNNAYLALMPFRLMQQKYLHLLDSAPDDAKAANFVRMEKWIFDSPAQAGAAFRQFVRWMFQENRLVAGTLEIGGQRVDLKRIAQPVLNIYGRKDHLVPPSASEPLGGLVGSNDYTALPFDLGHIGMYVSARAQAEVPRHIAQWLRERDDKLQ